MTTKSNKKDGEVMVMTSAEMLAMVEAKISGQPYQKPDPLPPPKTLEEEMWQLSHQLDDLRTRLDDLQETFMEFKMDADEKFLSLAERIEAVEEE